MPPKPKARAYSYSRISSPAQAKGDGRRRQIERSRKYATDHHLDLDESSELEDIGRSAFKGHHVSDGALGEFLRRVDAGEIPKGSFLLVESLDRLSRENVHIALAQLQAIVSQGIVVVTLNDGKRFNDLNDFGQLIHSVMSMFLAHEESRKKADRLGEVWREKRKNAAAKRMTRVCPEWLRPSQDGVGFEAIPERVAIVRQIFEASASGMGVYRIVRSLNEADKRAFRTRHWGHSYVKKILHNHAVRGHLHLHHMVNGKRTPTGDVVEGYYPRVIDDALFYRVQNSIASRTEVQDGRVRAVGGRTGSANTNLFKGLLYCASCGGRAVYLNKGAGPKGGSYVACSRAVRQGIGCSKKKMRYWEFESTVLRHARLFLTSALRGDDSRTKRLDDDLIVAKAKLAEAEKKAKYLDQLALAADELDSDTLNDRREVESVKIFQKKEIKRLMSEIESAAHADDVTHDLDEVIRALREEDSPDSVRDRARAAQLMPQVIERIDISFDGLAPFREEIWQSRFDAEIDEDEWDALLSPTDEATSAPALALTYTGDAGGDLIQTWRSEPQSLRLHCPLRPQHWESVDPKYYRPSAMIRGKMTALSPTATVNLHP